MSDVVFKFPYSLQWNTLIAVIIDEKQSTVCSASVSLVLILVDTSYFSS